MSDTHTILKQKGCGKESSKKEKEGPLRFRPAATSPPRTVRSAPRGPWGWVKAMPWSLFRQPRLQKNLPVSLGCKRGPIGQPFLVFSNPRIKTTVNKSTTHTMSCLPYAFCFQSRHAWWWAGPLLSAECFHSSPVDVPGLTYNNFRDLHPALGDSWVPWHRMQDCTCEHGCIRGRGSIAIVGSATYKKVKNHCFFKGFLNLKNINLILKL